MLDNAEPHVGERLIEAARAAINTHGTGIVPLHEIAVNAGTTQTTILNLFGSPCALIDEAIHRIIQERLSSWRECTGLRSPREAVWQLTGDLAAWARWKPNTYAAVFTPRHGDSKCSRFSATELSGDEVLGGHITELVANAYPWPSAEEALKAGRLHWATIRGNIQVYAQAPTQELDAALNRAHTALRTYATFLTVRHTWPTAPHLTVGGSR